MPETMALYIILCYDWTADSSKGTRHGKRASHLVPSCRNARTPQSARYCARNSRIAGSSCVWMCRGRVVGGSWACHKRILVVSCVFRGCAVNAWWMRRERVMNALWVRRACAGGVSWTGNEPISVGCVAGCRGRRKCVVSVP